MWNVNVNFDPINDFSLLDPLISDEENQEVIGTVSNQEIKNAVFQLDPDKSSGPDGYPPFFFQKYWPIVGNSLIRAFKALFHSGKLLKEINHTFIAMIPRIDNP